MKSTLVLESGYRIMHTYAIQHSEMVALHYSKVIDLCQEKFAGGSPKLDFRSKNSLIVSCTKNIYNLYTIIKQRHLFRIQSDIPPPLSFKLFSSIFRGLRLDKNPLRTASAIFNCTAIKEETTAITIDKIV